MSKRKSEELKLQPAGVAARTCQPVTGPSYDIVQPARRRWRRKSWADGFLTSHGTQMPLFVRSTRLFKTMG
jgi:hypothetical protein